MFKMSATNIQVNVEELIAQYNKAINELKTKLKYEREMRQEAEAEVKRLKQLTPITLREKTKKTSLDKRKEREAYQNRQLTGLKSDGKPIAHAGTPIDSYSEFDSIQKYLFENAQYREWLLWCLGCSAALRISDLIQLKWGYFFYNGEFRERFPKVEQKTGKLNNILITDFMKDTITKYLKVTGTKPEMDEYLFRSQKQFRYDPKKSDEENEDLRTKSEKSFKSTLSKNLKNAGKACGLEHKTAHSMRHTFTKIVNCVYDSSFDVKTIDLCCGLLNHSDIRTTMRYCGVLQEQLDDARRVVSNFLSGKSGIDKLEPQPQITNRKIYDLIKNVQEQLNTQPE